MSSTFYVSKLGNNANDGLSPGAAKLTLAGLQAVMTTAGDSAKIGPGTWRERYTVQANNQSFVFDPLCTIFTAETPGRCVVTGAGADEKPTSGIVWNFNAKTGCSIMSLGGIDAPVRIEGSSDNYAISGVVSDTIQYCHLGGYNGSYGVTPDHCSGKCSNAVFVLLGTATNCIAYMGGAAFLWPSSGPTGNATIYNCEAHGNKRGFQSQNTTYVMTVQNGLADGCDYGFVGDSRGLAMVTCTAQDCYSGATYGGSTTYPLAIGSVNVCNNVYNSRGGGFDSGTPTAVGATKVHSPTLVRALESIVYAGTGGLGTAAGAPTTDWLGRTRPNPPGIGAFDPTNSNGRGGIHRGRLVNCGA